VFGVVPCLDPLLPTTRLANCFHIDEPSEAKRCEARPSSVFLLDATYVEPPSMSPGMVCSCYSLRRRRNRFALFIVQRTVSRKATPRSLSGTSWLEVP
jgi:hypothetical protein